MHEAHWNDNQLLDWIGICISLPGHMNLDANLDNLAPSSALSNHCAFQSVECAQYNLPAQQAQPATKPSWAGQNWFCKG